MTTPQMDWLDDQRRKRAVSSDDIVTELRRQLGLCGHSSPTYTLADCIRCGRIQAVIDEIERLRAREQDLRMHAEQDACEIERLRAAGDALAHTLSVQSEWTCCADGWFGPCDCPPDAASRPTNGRVATALDTWKEARRG